MNISLIANSGIQFYKFNVEIDLNADVIKTMGFYEFEDESKGEISLQYAYKAKGGEDDDDFWVAKKELIEEGYLNENNKFIKDVNINSVKALNDEDQTPPEYFTISDIQESLELYHEQWLPFPYFKRIDGKSELGPKAWSRIKYKDITPKDYKKATRLYEINLAFDTKIDKKDSDYFTPRYDDTKKGDNFFGISNNEDHNLNFCNPDYKCGYVDEYLRILRHDGELPDKFPSLKYLADYLYIIKFMNGLEKHYQEERHELTQKLRSASNIAKINEIEKKISKYDNLLANGVFPAVVFHSDETPSVDVDLVLDIGNANTCGLLFESPTDKNENFKFNTVKKLEINDLSDIGKVYKEPFSMRLAFAEAKFGEIDIPEYQNCFNWPSILRVGKEAQRLITEYNIDIKGDGKETNTNCSSPKRYLWDNKKSKLPWEFVNMPPKKSIFDDDDDFMPEVYIPSERAYCEGITEQFTSSGEYTFETNSSVNPYYSRKSLMTFVYIETFLHAITQINSFKFRDDHGKTSSPRKLRRVTITSPTAIVQQEQVILRQAAVEAAITLKRYNEDKYNEEVEKKDIKIDFKVIPEPKNLARDLAQTRAGDKLDWIYDEATCNQLVFIYSEVSKRYLNNADAFFKLYGKKRNDVDETYQNALTIGTIDIGGGTTDLMIAAHEYASEQSNAVITPRPLYWESFTLAGDDLLKEIVQQIVIEGEIENDSEKGCKGVIKNYANDKKCKDVTIKIQNFFGKDKAKPNARQIIFRKNFNIQILIPIALRYLQHSSSGDEDIEIGYEDIFNEIKPNTELIRYINNHFGGGFNFEEIRWKLSKKRVFDIIETTFDPLFKKLSILMAAYGCDFVLLSGKPTTIPKIKDMFIKYYPVSPDRIISLNSYRVGSWYPSFGEDPDEADLGYFKDPKTIVAVGAIIALMGGRLDNLDAFKINTKYLIKELLPTTDYIGALDTKLNSIDYIYLSPDENKNTISVDGLPVVFGYKQLLNESYPARPIYKLEFNTIYIRKNILEANSFLDDENEINDKIENKILKIKQNTPLKIKLVRKFRESKEVIEITSIKGADKDELNERLLSLSLMTLPDETGYWLDTGEFVLQY